MKINNDDKSVDENIDRLNLQADQITKHLPPRLAHFDRESIWGAILVKLSAMDKRSLSWALAMAASVSLLVASNLIHFDVSTPMDLEDQTIAKSENKTESHLDHLSKINFDGVRPLKMRETSITMVSGNRKKNGVQKNDHKSAFIEYDYLKTNTNSFHAFPINLFAKVSYHQANIIPEIGINVSIFQRQKGNRFKAVDLGLSTQLSLDTNESGQNTLYNFLFFNVGYENVDVKTGKGWFTSASVLLNPDDRNIYRDFTMKFTVQRQINKHLRLGPELIFSNNFRKVYPGVSLTLI